AEQVELVVLRGSAELMNDDGGTSLRAGDRALARVGQAPSPAYVYNSAAWDAFDRWSDSRLGDRAGASAQNLPEMVQSYASALDRDGSWRADETYGQVWYPRVAADWRPYFSGRWASYPSYGWTWIGTEAWAWPTHHYGRWGFSAGAWFWIPGRTWSPAWVSWAYAPGYTSWCPLGWDNRAVLQFGRGYGGRYDHWNGWTVVANGRFGSGYVNTGYIAGGRIDVRTREAFVVRGGAPQSRGGYAVPRNAAPIRVAGSRGPGGYGSSGGLGSPGVDRGRLEDARPGLGARGSVGASGRNGTGGGVDRGPGGAARGDARTDPAGARTSRAPAGTDARPRATRPEVIRGGVRSDEAAAFRDRRTQSEPSGAGYPAPARAPRDSPEVVQRMGAPRERTAAPRAFDPASVPVYRGAVPRSADQPADRGPDDRTDASRRGPAAAAPAGAQPAPRTWSSDDHRQAPSPGSRSPEAAPRGGQIDRTPSPYRAAPREAQPSAPSPYRAAPREAQPSAPPSYRSYGGDERRPSPGPAAAPPREGGGAGAPRGPAPSSGAGQSRERPQGQPDRGTAVRRGRGEN
ncbi:MAG: DUF6600 domain-containing protein, partial [Vicinamibacterales bacterium]